MKGEQHGLVLCAMAHQRATDQGTVLNRQGLMKLLLGLFAPPGARPVHDAEGKLGHTARPERDPVPSLLLDADAKHGMAGLNRTKGPVQDVFRDGTRDPGVHHEMDPAFLVNDPEECLRWAELPFFGRMFHDCSGSCVDSRRTIWCRVLRIEALEESRRRRRMSNGVEPSIRYDESKSNHRGDRILSADSECGVRLELKIRVGEWFRSGTRAVWWRG